MDGSELTCPICLACIEPTDLAVIKGCEHTYCAYCILQWSVIKGSGANPPWCPQCKAPFNYLYTHRQLDGTLTDYAAEESVCLLKVARWFTDFLREADKGKLLCSLDAEQQEQEELDAYDDYDDGFDEDELLLRGPGRGRVVLGNRRLGENGFMRSGRVFARPVQPTPVAGGGRRKGKGAAATAASSVGAAGASNGGGGSSSSSGGGGPTAGSGAGGSAGVGAGTAQQVGEGGAGSGSFHRPGAAGVPCSGGTAGSSGLAGAGSSYAPGPAVAPAPAVAAAVGGGASSSSKAAPAAKANGGGRRAKRSQRRAAYDLDDDAYF